MSALWKRLEDKEEGFTLIELLVVVIIIGILAAIAIPVFLNQRESAWRSTAESDARNAAIAVETFLTANDDYPTTAQFTTMIADGDVQESNNVSLTYAPGSNAYTIDATHGLLNETITYNSAEGGLQGW